MGFYAVTEDCVVLDAETINGEVLSVLREKFCRAFLYARNILFFEKRRF